MLKGIKLDQFTAVKAIWGSAFMLAAEFCWIFRCSVHLDLLSAVVFCKIHCSQESATSGFHLPDIPLRPANICRGSCRFSSASDFKCLLIFLFWIPKSGTLNYAFWIFDRNVFLREKNQFWAFHAAASSFLNIFPAADLGIAWIFRYLVSTNLA